MTLKRFITIHYLFKLFEELFFNRITDRKFQVDCLDGIRGLAILFVLFSHVANANILLIEKLKFAGNGSGTMGVYMFFTLSAFLLTKQLIKIDDYNLRLPIVWVDYCIRRFLRIYPLYIIVLVFVLMGSFYKVRILNHFAEFDFSDFALHLMAVSGKVHFWTIVMEVKYYIFLPFFIGYFVFFLKRNITKIRILYLLALLFISYFTYISPSPDSRLLIYVHTLFVLLPIFLGGSLFAIIHEQYKYIKIKRSTLNLVGLMLFFCIIILMPNTYRKIIGLPYPFLHQSLTFFLGILFGSFIFIIHFDEHAFLSRIFSYKLFRFFGITKL